MTWVIPVVVWTLLTQSTGVPTQLQRADGVAAVRMLYSGAAYEDALALIAGLDPALVTADHELYRALCFLALGRSTDSEAALERAVRTSPLYVLPETEVTPRILTMFREVRKRVLPIVAREEYAAGKAHYDDRRFTDAILQFRRVTGLLADPDVAYPAGASADLRQLTEGFLRLAEMEVEAVTKATASAANVAAAAVPTPPAAGQPAGVTVSKIVVYSREDTSVVPPVEIERFMPPWVPPGAIARSSQEYRGEIEVIVDEIGRVEQARMTRPTVAAYDVTLLGAARRWRFQPARLAGEAVKYRVTVQILLAPRR